MKKGSKKRKTSHSTKSLSDARIDRAVAENFIGLQKVMVNLSTKFDTLSNQIAKLLELFEISAKSLVKKEFEGSEKGNKDMKRIMEKLDAIVDQSNLIGRGITLMHETGSERGSMPSQMSMQNQMPSMQQQKPMESTRPIDNNSMMPSRAPGGIPPMPKSSDEYRKSIQPKFSDQEV